MVCLTARAGENLIMLGTTSEQMKLIDVDYNYEFTQVISEWAKEKGYRGIKFEGTRGNGKDYVNFVIFNQSIAKESLRNYTKTDW